MKKAENKRWCGERSINARSMAKAGDILHQLRQHLVALDVPVQSCGTDTTTLRRALLSGLFLHAAVLLPDGELLFSAKVATASCCSCTQPDLTQLFTPQVHTG